MLRKIFKRMEHYTKINNLTYLVFITGKYGRKIYYFFLGIKIKIYDIYLIIKELIKRRTKK